MKFTNCFGYKIEYSDPFCQRNLTAPDNLSICWSHYSRFNNRNSRKSILSLMELAVRRNGSSYQFSKLFADHKRGYEVHQINGTFSDEMCMWNAYIDGNRISNSYGSIFRCVVKKGQTLVFRYEGNTSTTASTSTTSSTQSSSTPAVTGATTAASTTVVTPVPASTTVGVTLPQPAVA